MKPTPRGYSPTLLVLSALTLVTLSIGVSEILYPRQLLRIDWPANLQAYGPYLWLTASVLLLIGGAWQMNRQHRKLARARKDLGKQAAGLEDAVALLTTADYGAVRVLLAQRSDTTSRRLYLLAEQLQQEVLQAEAHRWHQATFVSLTDVVRRHRQVQPLAQDLLSQTVRQMKLAQGVIFLRPSLTDPRLEPVATFAMGQEADLAGHLNQTNSFLSQIARDGKAIYLEDLPQGFAAIRSGLGEAIPASLLLCPIRFEGTLIGVWEVAGFQPIPHSHRELLEEVADKSASTLYNLLQTDHTAQLLAESQTLTEELQHRTQAIQEAEQRLRQMNERLEENVKARTAELEHAMEELQTTQLRMIQSEKLASMGQLVAGVAHEINTPLGAIKASVVNMADSLPQALQSLPILMAALDEEARKLFVELIIRNADNNESLSTRDERRIRKEMTQQLDALGIAEPDEMARALFNAGVRGQVADLLPVIQHPRAEEILRTAYHFSQLRTNMNVIGHAVDKTRKTVYALKRYSHFQQEEEDQADWLDITDSLDVVLTMYHNQLKHGVEVTTDIRPLPRILGYSDELGQVWTNIIHNAAQAMQYNGKMHISTREESGYAVVSIADNGPGIPAEVLPRIFEPFFTTKRQGEGTGLGLDICKKIVEKHKGEISVDTGAEGTTFRIRIPVEQDNTVNSKQTELKEVVPV
ncbi:MAG: GAF domain-containing protein [Bacteroidetes bacterium]|nr:GAF domain-containing protein [Bacteroidota bacterium]